MLSVVAQNVAMMSVIMLSVVAPYFMTWNNNHLGQLHAWP
jgi:hypothetical protein